MVDLRWLKYGLDAYYHAQETQHTMHPAPPDDDLPDIYDAMFGEENTRRQREAAKRDAPKRQPHSDLAKQCKAALLAWHKAKGLPACGIPIKQSRVPILHKGRATGKTYQTGRIGAADLIWLCRGIAFAIEVKMPWDTQRGTQEAFQAKWEVAGGVYIIARSPQQLVADVERVMAQHHIVS